MQTAARPGQAGHLPPTRGTPQHSPARGRILHLVASSHGCFAARGAEGCGVRYGYIPKSLLAVPQNRVMLLSPPIACPGSHPAKLPPAPPPAWLSHHQGTLSVPPPPQKVSPGRMPPAASYESEQAVEIASRAVTSGERSRAGGGFGGLGPPLRWGSAPILPTTPLLALALSPSSFLPQTTRRWQVAAALHPGPSATPLGWGGNPTGWGPPSGKRGVGGRDESIPPWGFLISPSGGMNRERR